MGEPMTGMLLSRTSWRLYHQTGFQLVNLGLVNPVQNSKTVILFDSREVQCVSQVFSNRYSLPANLHKILIHYGDQNQSPKSTCCLSSLLDAALWKSWDRL